MLFLPLSLRTDIMDSHINAYTSMYFTPSVCHLCLHTVKNTLIVVVAYCVTLTIRLRLFLETRVIDCDSLLVQTNDSTVEMSGGLHPTLVELL